MSLHQQGFQAARSQTVPKSANVQGPVAFSIATLVTDPSAYAAMCQSFADAGFDAADCEFLTIDNTTTPQASAFAGLNRALAMARGRHVILCHQDVLLTHDDRAVLERRLAELDAQDPRWGVAGNAGGVGPGELAIRITDPHGADQRRGTFPARVASVDENFIVVKGGTRFGFSADLDGFHFYGADLCTQARIAGHTSYVIDFHLTHLSAGKAGAAFATAREAFTAKWARALEPTLIQTTCAVTALNPNPALGELQALTARLASAIGRRLKPRRGTSQQTQRPGTGQVSDTASAARS
jgi:hypothetical protein